MADESFTTKEMLVRLMTQMDKIETSVNKQELLLSTIHQESIGRDEIVKDLKTKVEELETTVKNLKSFNRTLIAVWSFVVTLLGAFGRDIFSKLF